MVSLRLVFFEIIGIPHMLLVVVARLLFDCVKIDRDVDAFIEKLESTISFLTGLEGKENGDDSEDDFVPFI